MIYDEIVVQSGPPPPAFTTTPDSPPDELVVERSSPLPAVHTPPSPTPSPRNHKRRKTTDRSSNNEEGSPDRRAFPHFHSLLVKLKETYQNTGISGDELRLTKRLRKYKACEAPTLPLTFQLLLCSWCIEFQRIAITLNLLLSSDSEPFLDPLERLTLTDLIARPPMFACVLVPHLIPSLVIECSKAIASIYSEFVRFVRYPVPPDQKSTTSTPHSSSPSDHPFPFLRSTLEGFAASKARLKVLKERVRAADALRNIHVHRLEYVPGHVDFEREIKKKKIVIDCPDYVQFQPTTYHHIDTKKVHTIEPIKDKPEFHVMVLETPDTPADDEDIINSWLKNRTGESVPDNFRDCYIGAQVFNVFVKDKKLRKQLSDLADALVKSINARKPIARGKNIPSEGKMAGMGQVWVRGNGTCRQYRNLKNNDWQAELLQDAEVAADVWIGVTFIRHISNLEILGTLFPDVVKQWRLNTLGVFDSAGEKTGCAAPTGFHGCAVTAFATMCYAAGVHCDSGDLGFTVGIRAFRAGHEPKEAYQFVHPSLRLRGSPHDRHGIILSQPTGAITLWASRVYHGSSVDVRADKAIPTGQGKSVGLVLVQKKSLFTFSKTSGLDSVMDVEAMGCYYETRLYQAKMVAPQGMQKKKPTSSATPTLSEKEISDSR